MQQLDKAAILTGDDFRPPHGPKNGLNVVLWSGIENILFWHLILGAQEKPTRAEPADQQKLQPKDVTNDDTQPDRGSHRKSGTPYN
jgi:hypothetical protein